MVAQGGTNGVNTSFFEFLWWHSVYVQLRYAFAVFGTRLKFLKKNLKWNELSSLNVNLVSLPNVFIEQGTKRVYPFNNLASHVIGYMATPKKSDIKINPIIKMMDILNLL